MKKLIKKTELLCQTLITNLIFVTSITVAQANPYVRTDYSNDSNFNSQAIFSYVDLGKVILLSNNIYRYSRTIVQADLWRGDIDFEKNLQQIKLLESEVIVNCNDVNSLTLLEHRYYQNSKLIKTEKPNLLIKHSESNPLKEGNLIVCRLFNPSSFQPLKPGLYYLGSMSIQIAVNGDRICFEGISRYGQTVQSVVHIPQYLSLYKLQFPVDDNSPFYLIQLTSNQLYYGDFENLTAMEIEKESIDNTQSKELLQCLNSNKPFQFSN